MRYSILFRIAGLALLALLAGDARAVTMSWSPVGNAGNAADTTGFGAVGYSYNIGTYDVTNSQYVEFLNTKDPTGANTLGLWNSNMADPTFGGISFNGGNLPGKMYRPISGNENHPVNYVSWYDAVRFANWLNNGQGTGDTESGAYTLQGGTPTPSNGLSITRNAGATVFLPSEDEWYKAAYNIPGTNSYFQYPTSSNAVPTASAPTGATNSANYGGVVGHLTDVGAYTSSGSPYGTFDQGGDVFQWTDTAVRGSTSRIVRGGLWEGNSAELMASTRNSGIPSSGSIDEGFRLAETPEPSTLVLAALGFVGLAWRLRHC